MSQRRSHISSRQRDFALYLVIALALALIAVIMGRSNLSLKEANQWLSLIFFTAILYGTFIALSRPLYRIRSFWIVTITSFLVHVSLFAAILTHVDQWRPMWSAVMFLEAPMLDALKRRFVHPTHKNRRI